MSKLADYLKTQKIDGRRVLSYSKKIEGFRAEDRLIAQARRVVKGGKPSDEQKALAEKSMRSGKAVSAPTLNAALAGKDLSRGAKQRILRAVNRVLETKKQSAAALSDLF